MNNFLGKNFIITQCFLLTMLTPIKVLSDTATANIKVKVINDKNIGVLSKLFIVDSKDSEKYIGRTSSDGGISVKYNCSIGDRVKAKPISANYYDSSDIDCYSKNDFVLKVTHKNVLRFLRANAAWAESTGKSAVAAYIYTDMAARLETIDKEQVNIAAEKSYQNAAKALNFPGKAVVLDVSQGKKVISVEFAEAIKKYQKSKSIESDGALNTPTLKALSGESVGEYMFKDFSKQ